MCKPILQDIDTKEVLKRYFGEEINEKNRNLLKTVKNDEKTVKNDEKTVKNDEKTVKNDNIILKCIKIKGDDINEYSCNYCNKKFKHKQSLNRHISLRCRDKKNINSNEYNDLVELVKLLNEQLKEKNKQLENQLKEKDIQISEKDKQINELIKKSGITNNIQNNIKVLSYKNTDISHLTDKDFMYCLNRSNMCIPHLIKKIHFNPNKPENHNIYISNIKNNYVMIYDGNKWVIKDRDESIEDLIDSNEFIIEQKLEEWIENGNQYPEIMNKFNRYIEKRESDSILDTIKKEIKLLLFNNRKLIKSV